MSSGLDTRRRPSTVSSVLDFVTVAKEELVEAQNEIGGYRDSIRTTARFVVWTLAWLVTLAVARFGPGLLWDHAADGGELGRRRRQPCRRHRMDRRVHASPPGDWMSCSERSCRTRWRSPSAWVGSADSPTSSRTPPASSPTTSTSPSFPRSWVSSSRSPSPSACSGTDEEPHPEPPGGTRLDAG